MISLSCKNLIKRAKDWILELRKSLPSSFPIILVGNKSDLVQKVKFQSHESITSYHETSAKLNTGIRKVKIEHKCLPTLPADTKTVFRSELQSLSRETKL